MVRSKFISLFHSVPLVVNSPGRINLIGEHTDYNEGYVMPAAIGKHIKIALAASAQNHSVVHAMKFDESFTIDITSPAKTSNPPWANYLLGIISRLNTKGHTIGNFNCVFDGDLPVGAGLSSSAALECGFVFALNELFRLKLTRHDMIHIAQWAEHNYADVKCGIMDQFASMMGKKDHVIVLDCRNMNHQYSPLQLGDHCLLLCDTNVKHSLASSEYNTRRSECEHGVHLLKSKFNDLKSLRDATPAMIKDNKEIFPMNVYKRCLYIAEENERVLMGAEDLQQGRLHAFGDKMFQTHTGLSMLYDVSCAELDFLVHAAKYCNGVIGARMMGGGFGGCTLNVIRKDAVEQFLKSVTHSYRKTFGIEMTSYVVETSDGTSINNNQ